MGLIKFLGKATGFVAGVALATLATIAGTLVGSEFLTDVGKGVYRATKKTGETLGGFTEGVAETIYGATTSNKDLQSKGFDKVADTTSEYACSLARGVKGMGIGIANVASATCSGDTEKIIDESKKIAKVAIIGVLSIGIIDVFGADIADFADDVVDDVTNFANDDILIENPNTHYVAPHIRTLASGEEILVNGFIRSNPDYRV